MFRLRFADGGELQLTEAGSKKRAGVWLLRPDAVDGGARAPRARGRHAVDARTSARILASDSRRLHSLLRDQRLIAGIGRAWANEILWAAKLSPYALSTQVDDEEIERLATAIRDELARGLELRLAGRSDANDLPRAQQARRAVRALRHADRAGRLRGAHDLLLPDLPDRRAHAQGPPPLAAPQVALSTPLCTTSRTLETVSDTGRVQTAQPGFKPFHAANGRPVERRSRSRNRV